MPTVVISGINQNELKFMNGRLSGQKATGPVNELRLDKRESIVSHACQPSLWVRN